MCNPAVGVTEPSGVTAKLLLQQHFKTFGGARSFIKIIREGRGSNTSQGFISQGILGQSLHGLVEYLHIHQVPGSFVTYPGNIVVGRTDRDHLIIGQQPEIPVPFQYILTNHLVGILEVFTPGGF